MMSDLISGKEAKLAWANGAEIEFYSENLNEWFLVDGETFTNVFDKRKCRIKPQTITVNALIHKEPKKITLTFDCNSENDTDKLLLKLKSIFSEQPQ